MLSQITIHHLLSAFGALVDLEVVCVTGMILESGKVDGGSSRSGGTLATSGIQNCQYSGV